jgi:hypothetical protein
MDLSSDSTTLNNWTFGKLLDSNKQNIPEPRVVPNDAGGLFMPFVYIVERIPSEHAKLCISTYKITNEVYTLQGLLQSIISQPNLTYLLFKLRVL